MAHIASVGISSYSLYLLSRHYATYRSRLYRAKHELIKNRYYLYCSTISAFCSSFCKKCKPVVTRPFNDHRYVRYCIEPTPCRICKGEPLRFYLLYELMVITEICSLYASHAT